MIDKFEEALGKGTLNLLPDHPRFVFCATDMAVGATRGPKDRCGGRGREAGLSSNFVFERDRVGSYLAGYAHRPRPRAVQRRASERRQR